MQTVNTFLKHILVPRLLISILFFSACKKDVPPAGKRDFKATITFADGHSVLFNAAGYQVSMSKSWWIYGPMINANTDAGSIYLTVYPNAGMDSVTTAGTYVFTCQYRVNTANYQNFNVSDPGSLTFTSFTDHFMAGYFNAECKYNNDSVTVQGTFSGQY